MAPIVRSALWLGFALLIAAIQLALLFGGGIDMLGIATSHAVGLASGTGSTCGRIGMRIEAWAEGQCEHDLRGDIDCMATDGTAGSAPYRLQVDQAVIRLFTHQTDHRGQIQAILTAVGETAPVSDIIRLPEEV